MAGNWKMNTSLDEAVGLAMGIRDQSAGIEGVELIVFPPTIWLNKVSEVLRGSRIMVGAQNMYHEASGAFTGEVAGSMVKELATHVIVGHSERRWLFGELDEMINKKLNAAVQLGLVPILAVGERLEDRQAGNTEKTIGGQLRRAFEAIPKKAGLIVAYEPVWAIGTGHAATPEIANEAIAFARSVIGELYGADFSREVRILYGGSVSPDNVAGLMGMPDIDGALVGGASLGIDSFLALARQGEEGNA